MTTRDFLQRFWLRLSIAVLIAIFAGAGVLIWQTLPPRTIVMATGAVGGANHALGIRYREILTWAGVKLQLLPTSGGIESLARLKRGLFVHAFDSFQLGFACNMRVQCYT